MRASVWLIKDKPGTKDSPSRGQKSNNKAVRVIVCARARERERGGGGGVVMNALRCLFVCVLGEMITFFMQILSLHRRK